ncbi:MAG: radical SAM protein [Acidimicrobiales bacterium]
MRVLMLSTYELGHQPLGIAVPAAALEAAGHETLGCDLSIASLAPDALAWADAAAISVPMHTATQLGLEAVASIRRSRPTLPVAWHGLYAPALSGNDLVGEDDLLVAGEAVAALLEWLQLLETTEPGRRQRSAEPGVRIELGPARPSPVGTAPLRRDLQPLERYAHLNIQGREIVAASVAASTGCNHRCRHCPVAAIYKGRSRAVPAELVIEDVAQVVAAGAGHISFADPDFLNRPRHALEVARRLHSQFPAVTFDATVKVEHILAHEKLWPELAAAGLLFVVSAFESVDDQILALLDKGHSAGDEAVALGIARSAGVEVRPSWLPFTPWTTLGSFAALLEFVAEHDLVLSTDPVQYSIRLLLPSGSLLLEQMDGTLSSCLGEVVAGSTTWTSPDVILDGLATEIAARAEVAGDEPLEVTFAAIWQLAREAGAPLAASPPPSKVAPWLAGPERARLSESWFCCAEPTGAQLQRLRLPA